MAKHQKQTAAAYHSMKIDVKTFNYIIPSFNGKVSLICANVKAAETHA